MEINMHNMQRGRLKSKDITKKQKNKTKKHFLVFAS